MNLFEKEGPSDPRCRRRREAARWAPARYAQLAWRRLAGERGNALPEFALVVPILLLLLFGMLDFGKAFNYWIDETHLAASGARFAVVNSAPSTLGNCPSGAAPSSLQQYIQCQADTSELLNGSSSVTKAKVCISFPNGNSRIGDPVRISVSTNYNWLPILTHRLPVVNHQALPAGAVTISASATMRLEAAATNYSAGCYPA
jgi:hypothetical protein